MIQYVNNVHGWGDWINGNGGRYAEPTEWFDSGAQVKVGNDVWIGQGVFLKSGVSVGDGAIIGAHSVVTRDVEPFAVVAGVPARNIRTRFHDVLVERIISSQWWNYNIMELPDLNFSRPEVALDTIEGAIADGSLRPLSNKKYPLT